MMADARMLLVVRVRRTGAMACFAPFYGVLWRRSMTVVAVMLAGRSYRTSCIVCRVASHVCQGLTAQLTSAAAVSRSLWAFAGPPIAQANDEADQQDEQEKKGESSDEKKHGRGTSSLGKIGL
jgi:hypothetical protein